MCARRFSFHLALTTSSLSVLGLDALLLVLVLGLAHLLPEQVLGVRPDLGALPLGELEERGDEVLAELFGGFSGQLDRTKANFRSAGVYDYAGKEGQGAHEGRQVVDSDHGHPRVTLTDLDLDGGFRERGVHRGIDGDRVVRVGSAAKRINNLNCQSC